MPVPDLQMQRHARAPEGLALTWDAVPGVARYGLIVGIPDAPLPSLDAIMKGETRAFALVGIPIRYTGAIDLGTPVGAERQYGLIAYRGDGTIVAVPGVRYCPAQDAPRGRDYHLFRPRQLERPASALPQSSSAAPQETPLAVGDPWTALRTASSAAAPAEREEASAVPAHEPLAGGVSAQAAGPPAGTAVDDVSAPAVAATAVNLPIADALVAANGSTPQPNGVHEPQGPPEAQPAPPSDAPAVANPPRVAQDEVTVEAVAVVTPVGDAHVADAAEPAPRAEPDTTPPPGKELSEAPSVAAAIVAEDPSMESPAIAPASQTSDRAGAPQVDAALADTPAEPLPALSASLGDQVQAAAAAPVARPDLSAPAKEAPSAGGPDGDEISGAAAFIREDVVEPEGAGNPAAPAVAAHAVDAVPLRPAAPAPAELVALLDEAEVYLLPQWADYAEAGRLLQQAAAIDAGNARLQSLQEQLQRAQHGDAEQGPDALLQEARQALESEDYWQAVDAYEEVLGRYPDNAEARQGVARARALARWSARMLGAGQDAEQVQRVATEFATNSPDLAARSYATAFGLRPTIVTLHGWLLALAALERPATVVETAEHGVQVLRQGGRIADDPAQDEALAALRAQTVEAPGDGVEQAIKHLTQVLVASSQREPQRS